MQKRYKDLTLNFPVVSLVCKHFPVVSLVCKHFPRKL